MTKRRKPTKRQPRRKQTIAILDRWKIPVEKGFHRGKNLFNEISLIPNSPISKAKKKHKPLMADVTTMEGIRRAETRKQCRHERTNEDGTPNGALNIKWMQHSNDIVLGVCGTCFSQFDARKPEDLQWLLKDQHAQRFMGKARASEEDIKIHQAKQPTEPPSLWKKFIAWIKRMLPKASK